MIECSFCKVSKSESYLYAACSHFICLNCAALRVDESLICCNQITALEEKAKTILSFKKQSILKNLQNDYSFQKTDLSQISFIQKPKNQRNSQQKENALRTKLSQFQEQEPELEKVGFYKSSQDSANKVQPGSIKIIQCLDFQDEIIPNRLEISPKHQKKCQYLKLPFQRSRKSPTDFVQQQFFPILEKQINSVKELLGKCQQKLQKIQMQIIDKMKIYFEDFMKAYEKQTQSKEQTQPQLQLQKSKLDAFLKGVPFIFNLQKFQGLMEKSCQLHQKFEKALLKHNSFSNAVINEISPQSSTACAESWKFNSQKPRNKQRNKGEDYEQNIQNAQNFQLRTTDKGLGKIYKKLAENQTKLEERMLVHKQFINKKCLKMSHY